MSEAERLPADTSRPGVRFPWAPALLAVASVAIAAWLWMRYSYAWEVTPGVLTQEAGFFSSRRQSWDRAYARVRGTIRMKQMISMGSQSDRILTVWVRESANDRTDAGGDPGIPRINAVQVMIPVDDLPEPYQRGEWTGRVDVPSSAYDEPTLDTTASRFAPESVAGLVVGAWGLFVFALHLLPWLAERRVASDQLAEKATPHLPPMQ